MGNNKANRAFTCEELYSLLMQLGVSFDENDYDKFMELFNKVDKKFGNPDDRQSMIDFTWLLLNFQVDIWDNNNRKVIDKAIKNKKVLEIDSIGEQGVKNLKLNYDKNTIDMERYVKILMFELGFRPNFTGFNLFKDGVIYLLNTDEKMSWTKVIYPNLGKKYELPGFKVERAIRSLIEGRRKIRDNSEVCQFVYRGMEHITVSDCLCLVTEYIRVNYKKIVVENYKLDNSSIKLNGLQLDRFDSNVVLDQIVSYLLVCLKIYPNIKGYYFLRDAVRSVLKTDVGISWVNLYSSIAENFGESYTKIERDIRHACSKISNHCQNINLDDLDTGNISDIEKFIVEYGCNFMSSELISLLCEYIKMNFKEYCPIQEVVSIDKKVRKRTK